MATTQVLGWHFLGSDLCRYSSVFGHLEAVDIHLLADLQEGHDWARVKAEMKVALEIIAERYDLTIPKSQPDSSKEADNL